MRRRRPGAQFAIHSFVPSIEGEHLAMTGTNSTYKCSRNKDSAYPPPVKQLCARSHGTGRTGARTRSNIVFCIQRSLAVPVPVLVPTSVPFCMLTISKPNLHKAPTKSRNAENDARIEKPLYRSLNALRVKVCKKWMCRLSPRVCSCCCRCCPSPASSSAGAPPRLIGLPEAASVLGLKAVEPGGAVPRVLRA